MPCRLLIRLALIGLFLSLKCALAQPHATGLREQRALNLQIYIYDLPANFQNSSSLPTNIQADHGVWGYGGEKRVPEALKEAGYVTQNASQASFFVVPVWLYAVRFHKSLQIPGSPVRSERQVLITVINYVSTHYPFWNATQGRDHIFTLTNDNGFCGFARGEETFDEVKDSIILTHWGLESTEVHCSLMERLASFNACPKRAEKAGKPEHLPCFNPQKDVVIASPVWDGFNYVPLGADHNHRRRLQSQHQSFLPSTAQAQRRHLHAVKTIEAVSSKKVHTLFFAGSTRDATPEYSHGVRQTLAALFNSTPGFWINRRPLSHEALVAEMGRSHFCLAPSGQGWGSRFKLVVLNGCIPLVIQDGVQMPYEDVLPYKDFALRLPQHAIHDLPRILEELLAKQSQRVKEMRDRLQCAKHWLSWKPESGRAVHALACSLLIKLHRNEIVPHLHWNECVLQCDAPQR